MNVQSSVRDRGAMRWWERLLLGVICLGGSTVLLSRMPQLPVAPWAAVRPTDEDIIRTLGLVAVWGLLALACLIAGWFAVKPGRVERSPESEPAVARRATGVRRFRIGGENGDLLALFATPWARTDGEAGVEPPLEAVAAVAPGSRAVDDEEGSGRVLLRLFGPLSVEGVGAGDGLRERPTRGLIAFLALKRAPASLDELSEALWPDESPTKSRQRLWKAKRQAQRLLGDALLRRGDTYELDRSSTRLDVDELNGRRSEDLTPGELEDALGLVEGRPLADVDYPWADGERRRLQAIQADLFTHAAVARLEVGDGRGALEVAERLIESDSLNEEGWRIAMQADALLGRRRAVLERFERLRTELDERLGLRPQALTQETYRQLLGQG